MYSARSTKRSTFKVYSARSIFNYNYLRVKPLVFSSTLSHMWDRLNLPMLLFKEGLLTIQTIFLAKARPYIKESN